MREFAVLVCGMLVMAETTLEQSGLQVTDAVEGVAGRGGVGMQMTLSGNARLGRVGTGCLEERAGEDRDVEKSEAKEWPSKSVANGVEGIPYVKSLVNGCQGVMCSGRGARSSRGVGDAGAFLVFFQEPKRPPTADYPRIVLND